MKCSYTRGASPVLCLLSLFCEPSAKVNHILKVASVCILFRRPERTVFLIQFLLHYVAGGLVDSDSSPFYSHKLFLLKTQAARNCHQEH